MARKMISNRCCSNPVCPRRGRFGAGNILRHGFFPLSQGRRRRFRCIACGVTFSSTKGTPYYRLHTTRRALEEIAEMSVEGASISSIARMKRLSWNSILRRLERVSIAARRFNRAMTRDYPILEIQADEIRTFSMGKETPIWVLTGLEVWSRLWTSAVVGGRTYKNIRRVLKETLNNGRFNGPPLIATDGYEYYAHAIWRDFKNVCIHGEVLKTWRNNKAYRVERRTSIGTDTQIWKALLESEDSNTLNTSFIERLNLTIRQGCSYLHRRSTCHSRDSEYLGRSLDLLRCHYNFIRPHRALRFGKETRTPAMQAGLVSKRLTFRDVFTAQIHDSSFVAMVSCPSTAKEMRRRWRIAA
jgi:transposase-like protein/IS1 family transposase